jgi:hypothetical protein
MIHHGDRDVDLDRGYRADHAVADSVVLQPECRQLLSPVQEARRIPYLKLTGKRVELILDVPVATRVRGRCRNRPFLVSGPRCLCGE